MTLHGSTTINLEQTWLYLRLISFRNINSIYLPKYSQELDRPNLLSYGINTTAQKKKTTGKLLVLNAILQD